VRQRHPDQHQAAGGVDFDAALHRVFSSSANSPRRLDAAEGCLVPRLIRDKEYLGACKNFCLEIMY
jgi:hypothetical protein